VEGGSSCLTVNTEDNWCWQDWHAICHRPGRIKYQNIPTL